jgi:hypothetical protein
MTEKVIAKLRHNLKRSVITAVIVGSDTVSEKLLSRQVSDYEC